MLQCKIFLLLNIVPLATFKKQDKLLINSVQTIIVSHLPAAQFVSNSKTWLCSLTNPLSCCPVSRNLFLTVFSYFCLLSFYWIGWLPSVFSYATFQPSLSVISLPWVNVGLLYYFSGADDVAPVSCKHDNFRQGDWNAFYNNKPVRARNACYRFTGLIALVSGFGKLLRDVNHVSHSVCDFICLNFFPFHSTFEFFHYSTNCNRWFV